MSINEIQKLLPSFGSRPHATEHTTSGSCGASLLNAAHDHTEMTRFDNDGDSLWLQHFRKRESDLFSQAFLYLEAAGKHFGDAGELRKADHPSIRDVANVHLEFLSDWLHCRSNQG